ncbi:transcription factor Adf-1-like [Schistocerca serialis cubense]|uniref:transcription factor Adf-1-like n=1 Tax=Schistocerca serialis cubense TaxID=2023355 RepID=UPI00214EE608|nr:transcription factor Adf-1-like [Schistocerca serialis cubense]
MDVERLIEEVRKFPVLYDQGSENYRNIEYKDRVWKTIATDLQAKGGIEECKKKWASVRDQLRKTLQKRKTVSGQAAVHQHKYKYEDLLTFLLPYMVERETVSSVPYTQDNNEHKQESNTDSQEEQSIVENEKVSTQEDIADEEWIIKTQDSETENLIERTRHSQTPSAHSSVTSKKNTFIKPPLKRKFQREVKPQESASSQLMAYILAEKKLKNREIHKTQLMLFWLI